MKNPWLNCGDESVHCLGYHLRTLMYIISVSFFQKGHDERRNFVSNAEARMGPMTWHSIQCLDNQAATK